MALHRRSVSHLGKAAAVVRASAVLGLACRRACGKVRPCRLARSNVLRNPPRLHITGRPTRTHNSRRRRRRKCCAPVAFNVMWHWRRMRSASKFIALQVRAARASGTFSSEKCSRRPFFGGRRVGAPPVVRVAPGQDSCGRARLRSFGVGMPAGLLQSEAMPPCSLQHSVKSTTATHNWSAHADSQQQEAASRHVLCSGGLQRSTSWRRGAII